MLVDTRRENSPRRLLVIILLTRERDFSLGLVYLVDTHRYSVVDGKRRASSLERRPTRRGDGVK
jgi:hypothetical protein